MIRDEKTGKVPLDSKGEPFFIFDAKLGHGTGSVISRDGLILTARHVVTHEDQQGRPQDAIAIAVWLPGETEPRPARRVYYERDNTDATDYAFIKVDATFQDGDLVRFPASFALNEGAVVKARGYPLEADEETSAPYPGTVSRPKDRKGLIEVDVTLEHGMSGGPICTSAGLVGIAQSIKGRALNFAVPAETAHSALKIKIPRDRSIERAAEEMHGDTWRAYSEFAVATSKYLVKVKDKPEDAFGTWLEDLSQLMSSGSSPEADIVMATLLWTSTVQAMAKAHCYWHGAAKCASVEDNGRLCTAVALVNRAIAGNPRLKDAAGQEFVGVLSSMSCTTHGSPPPPPGPTVHEGGSDVWLPNTGVTITLPAGSGQWTLDAPAMGSGGQADRLTSDSGVIHADALTGDCADAPVAGSHVGSHPPFTMSWSGTSEHMFCSDLEAGKAVLVGASDQNVPLMRVVEAIGNAAVKTYGRRGETSCRPGEPGCPCPEGDPNCGTPGGSDERPYAQWETWLKTQVYLYGGAVFPTPFGSTEGGSSWGLGVAFTQRLLGDNASSWFTYELGLGAHWSFFAWPDGAVPKSDFNDVPHGVTFGMGSHLSLRAVIGEEAGLWIEPYYPITLLISDPVAVGYQQWGARLGFFFDGTTTLGVDLRQIAAGSADYGVWTLFGFVSF